MEASLVYLLTRDPTKFVLEGPFRDLVEDLLQKRDIYIQKVEDIFGIIKPNDLVKMTEDLARKYLPLSLEELSERTIEYYSKNPSKYIFDIQEVTHIHLATVSAGIKLLEELESKDIPLSALYNKNTLSILLEYFREHDIGDSLFRAISYNVDKELAWRLAKTKIKLIDDIFTATTPSLDFIHIYLSKLRKKGEDITPFFLGSRIYKERYLRENKPHDYDTVTPYIIIEKKYSLQDKYGNIVWSIDALLIYDNFHSIAIWQLSHAEIEDLYIRYSFANDKTNCVFVASQLDEILNNMMKTVKLPIKQYHQRWHCVIAANLIAASVWVKELQDMRSRDFAGLEKALMKKFVWYPYTYIPPQNIAKYLIDTYNLDDSVLIYKLEPDYEWVFDPKQNNLDNLDFVYKKLQESGLMLWRFIDIDSFTVIEEPVSIEFAKMYTQYPKIHQELVLDPRVKVINEKPTIELLKSILDQGKAIAVVLQNEMYDVGHMVVIEGYDERFNGFYMWDQATGRLLIHYKDIIDYLKTPFGWFMVAYGKKVESLNDLKKVTDTMSDLNNKIKYRILRLNDDLEIKKNH